MVNGHSLCLCASVCILPTRFSSPQLSVERLRLMTRDPRSVIQTLVLHDILRCRLCTYHKGGNCPGRGSTPPPRNLMAVTTQQLWEPSLASGRILRSIVYRVSFNHINKHRHVIRHVLHFNSFHNG